MGSALSFPLPLDVPEASKGTALLGLGEPLTDCKVVQSCLGKNLLPFPKVGLQLFLWPKDCPRPLFWNVGRGPPRKGHLPVRVAGKLKAPLGKWYARPLGYPRPLNPPVVGWTFFNPLNIDFALALVEDSSAKLLIKRWAKQLIIPRIVQRIGLCS